MKTHKTPSPPETASSTEPAVVSGPSSTRLEDLYRTPEFQAAWGNSVRFVLARHLVRLRRYRRWTQARVAVAMGTSQSAIARIEGAEENVTADTLERHINALEGRFDVSIAPRELHFPRWDAWWDLVDGGVGAPSPYDYKGIVALSSGDTLRVIAGWQSGDANLLSSTTTASIASLTGGTK